MQAVADEKKKKRDEKLRQAQQQREAQEREKAEKYKKMFLVCDTDKMQITCE